MNPYERHMRKYEEYHALPDEVKAQRKANQAARKERADAAIAEAEPRKGEDKVWQVSLWLKKSGTSPVVGCFESEERANNYVEVCKQHIYPGKGSGYTVKKVK